MHIVDDGKLAKYICDPDRAIPPAHVNKVCKDRLKGNCRYLLKTPACHVCTKHTPLRPIVDQRVEEGKHGTGADNCPGFGKM